MTIRTTRITTGLIAASLATVFASGAAQAALIDRGGGLIYDTDLNVTWLQNANAALGSSYDSADGVTDGKMTWQNAVDWAANLSYFDSVRNVTYTDWRLPTIAQASGCGWFDDPGCVDTVNTWSNEMRHLYAVELGNTSYLGNVGPFTNFQAAYHWFGTEYLLSPTINAWVFRAADGGTDAYSKAVSMSALAVRYGDVAAVPEAQTYALMLAGLGLVGWRAGRRG